MKKKYKKVIYIFSCIILFSIIGGVVKYSLRYIDDNTDLYIPKTNDISTWTSEEICRNIFLSINPLQIILNLSYTTLSDRLTLWTEKKNVKRISLNFANKKLWILLFLFF